MKYVYDVLKLRVGDIILVRFPDDELSKRIMDATGSEYSHAMLYIGGTYIEAGNRVSARNISRLLFDDPADTCVLRIKDELLTEEIINNAVDYARMVVGNPYALIDAVRLESGYTDRSTANTQTCTRLVAKAFAQSGMKLVDNVEMCTPQQLLESGCIDVHRDFCREATDIDIRLVNSYDVTNDMVKTTEKLFDSLKSFDGGRIRSMDALIQYVLDNPRDDSVIAGILEQSGYLDVYKIEEEKNHYNYDENEFISFWGDYAPLVAQSSLKDSFSEGFRYSGQYDALRTAFVENGSRSRCLTLFLGLYENLMKQCALRACVCEDVLDSFS